MASDGEQYESVGDEHHSDDDDDDNINKRDDDSSPSIERRQADYQPADDTYECLPDNQSNASSADGRGRDSDQGRRADDSDDNDSERAAERRTSDGADRMSDTGHLSDRRSVDDNIYDEVGGQYEVHELQQQQQQQQQQHQLQQHDDDDRDHIDAQKATSSEAPAAHVNRENVRIQENKKESAAGRFVIRSSRQVDAMYYLDNIINEEDRRRGIDATKEVVSRRLTTNKDSIHVVATPKSHPSPLAATTPVATKSPLAATSPVAAKSPESPTSPSITHTTAQQNVKVTKEVKTVKLANAAVNSDSPLSPGAQGPQSPHAQWRMDIEERKKSKSYVVAHKPEQPLRLGLVPEWKKQLQDKTKIKRMSSVDGYENGTVTSPDSTKASPVSPWKLEIEQLKKMSVASPADDDSQDVPEWVKVQQEKRTAKGAVAEKNK